MEIDLDQPIVRQPDGTLVVTAALDRREAEDEDGPSTGGTVTLHPGEGGYDDALAAWDLQHNPDRPAAVSTASGREQAMSVVHAVATGEPVEQAVAGIAEPDAVVEALRHVLVGGDPSVAAFADEIAESQADEPIAAHTVAKAIGNVLATLES